MLMSNDTSYEVRLEELKAKAAKLEDGGSQEVIEETAKRLEGFSYAPPVITATGTFLRLDKKGLLEEIERVVAMPEAEACALAPGDSAKCEDLRLEFIRVIIYYYEKLLLLRQGDAEEWDEVDELYVHD